MKRPVLAVLSGALLAMSPANTLPSEASLRAADAEQMRIIIQADANAQQQFMHPNYIINAPANVVRHKDEVVAELVRGGMATETFERIIEGTALTGSVGVVMGREVVKPSPMSNLGKLYPGRTLQRRFTNVFLWEGTKWRFLARHASIVAP